MPIDFRRETRWNHNSTVASLDKPGTQGAERLDDYHRNNNCRRDRNYDSDGALRIAVQPKRHKRGPNSSTPLKQISLGHQSSRRRHAEQGIVWREHDPPSCALIDGRMHDWGDPDRPLSLIRRWSGRQDRFSSNG